MEFDLSEYKDDPELENKLRTFLTSMLEVEEMCNRMLVPNVYESMDMKSKLEYDLFLAYAVNTLKWIYIRTNGKDPNQAQVKEQLTRIRDYMFLARRTIEPPNKKLDIPAAKRFITHGLKKDLDQKPPNKKIKFDE